MAKATCLCYPLALLARNLVRGDPVEHQTEIHSFADLQASYFESVCKGINPGGLNGGGELP